MFDVHHTKKCGSAGCRGTMVAVPAVPAVPAAGTGKGAVGVIGLRWVLDAIGSGLLDLVVAESDPGVRDVVVAEPDLSDQDACQRGDAIHPGDLVLGVGVPDEDRAVALVERCGRAGAAALLLRPPVVDGSQVADAAGAAGVALVSVRGQVSWAQLVWLLRSVVDTGSVGMASGPESPAFHDLFALADAAAAVIDAPVTIEDEYSRVLAYSRRQEQVDAARLSTIVGRRVPATVLRQFRSRGVFRKLGSGSEPIFVPGQSDGTMPRLIVPVRVGGQLLGSIWALVAERPSDERVHAFADTASVVALHLLRVRASADVARRLAADRLRGALSGQQPVPARELGLPAGPYRAVVLDLLVPPDAADPPSARMSVPAGEDTDGSDGPQRWPAAGARPEERMLALWESVSRSRGWRRPALTDLDGVLYAVVTGSGSEPGSWTWLRRTAAEALESEPGVRVAAGGAVDELADLPRSAAQAASLRRLVARGFVTGPVAEYEECWAAAVLDRVTGALELDELVSMGPLEDLLTHDSTRGGWYAVTLRAELEHPGDPGAASRQLHVHPNTFRYRMRRLRAALAVDLESPEVRLALQIQLSALRLHG